MRKSITVRGVDVDACDALRQIRGIEQRLIGAILSEAILDYWDRHYEGDDIEKAVKPV